MHKLIVSICSSFLSLLSIQSTSSLCNLFSWSILPSRIYLLPTQIPQWQEQNPRRMEQASRGRGGVMPSGGPLASECQGSAARVGRTLAWWPLPCPLTKMVPALLAGRQSCHTSHLHAWPQSRELLSDSQSDPPILSGKGSSWAHSGGLCGGEGLKSPG